MLILALGTAIDTLRADFQIVEVTIILRIIEHLAQTAGEHLLPALEYLGNALSYLFEQAEPWMPHLANVATIIIK